MLGLIRGTVMLCEHDARWMIKAQETIALLKGILGDAAVDIQHVGSTAVPGLAAKPIIDIVIGVRDLNDLDPFAEKLARQGIREAGQDLPGQRLFVAGDFEANTRTHHIHAVVFGSAPWNNYLRFRDCLRDSGQKRAEYEAEKRRLAALHPLDRQAYTAGKAALILRLLSEDETARKNQQ